MREYAIALGGSVGDVAGTMAAALEALETAGGRVLRTSRVYRTAPIGRASGPFLNAAAAITFDGSAAELLAVCQMLERNCGRRPTQRWDDRPVDIDLILGPEPVTTPTLRLPHPWAHLRRFVLEPLCELAADRVLPATGRTVADVAAHWRRPLLRVQFEDAVPPVDSEQVRPVCDHADLVIGQAAAAGWPPRANADDVPLPDLWQRRDAILLGVLDCPRPLDGIRLPNAVTPCGPPDEAKRPA